MATSSVFHCDPTLWETLRATPEYQLARNGRFLKAALLCPHLVISTSARNGGQRDDLQYLVNHQSCEAKDHVERHLAIKESGQEGYHDQVCEEIGIDSARAAVMGTAANMNYANIVTHEDAGIRVTAIVTAGVSGNATCAGDPAGWRETDGSWEQVNPVSGTINTMVLINHDLTEAALARGVLTMCEAKSAALARLAIGSLYSQDAATGTGTDQFCIAAARLGNTPLTSTSPHVMLGQLIGTAVRDATLETLRWQNGLEPSYTRSIFHALGRFGLKEATIFESLALLLAERPLDLLRKNSKAAFYDPMVSAAAYAIAAILDRVRYETLPASIACESLRQQGASLAVALSSKPGRWSEFRAALPDPDPLNPVPFVCSALAQGWSGKWS